MPISIAALHWLSPKLRAKKRCNFDPNLIDADPLACLSKRNRDFINNGAPETTRNIRLFAAACDMHGNEFHMNEAISTLTRPAIAAGLPHSEVIETIKKAYRKNRTPAKPTKTTTLRGLPTWARAQLWAMSHQWTPIHVTWTSPKDGQTQNVSVTAQTARDVFLALCERSRRDSAEVFRASRREIAEIANVDRMTAHRAILCLSSAGYILQRNYAANGAALFAFGSVVLREAYSNPPGSDISVTRSNSRSETRADVFRRGALGKSAERVWWAILPPNSPATKAEIARRAKCSRSTVTRLLSDDGLPKWGLVSRLDNRLWIGNAADDRYLYEVAVKSGTAGLAAKRRAQHAAERAKYAAETILHAKRRWEQIHLGRSHEA